jgi:DNA (cytosine-5)-methyltransferase 1
MAEKKGISEETSLTLARILDVAFGSMEAAFANKNEPTWPLSSRFVSALQAMSDASNQASSAFTNLVTCLAIKAASPELDVRQHQVQIGAPFSFRAVSEKIVYPWLRKKSFEGAKSGWQTRTFERPRAYTLDFPENIGAIKGPFLACFDEIQENRQDPTLALQFLIYRQLILREQKRVALADPNIDDIGVIVGFFSSHFFYSYASKGASRLPVLAIYAIYQAMMSQLTRYSDKRLRSLHSHAAADSQTGAIGDLQVEREDGKLFEGLEIKHSIRITPDMIEDVAAKIAPSAPERYYILTTHADCQPTDEVGELLKDKRQRIGTQIIVNGVIPTMRYYLRLLDSPRRVFPYYIALLSGDAAISHEHRAIWNDIVTGKT